MLLTGRVKSILLQPRQTWRTIDTEFTKPADVWGRYVLPLAALGPVAVTISWIIFGKPVLATSLTNRVPVSTAITRGVTEYVLTVLAVFVLMHILSILAPSFGGQKNDVQALKAAAYSHTAAWVGGVFSLIPALWP
ncbi:MAG: Yip1 family protein, partial [Gemmatimonadales bacterium]